MEFRWLFTYFVFLLVVCQFYDDESNFRADFYHSEILIDIKHITLNYSYLFTGTELVGPSYRMFAGFVIHAFYAIGYMTLAGLSYGIGNWRYIELVITVPVVLFVPYIW